jgi:hypothetical protein
VGLAFRASAIIALLVASEACRISHPPGGAPELWRRPENIESFDFTNGAHGSDFMPKPPFRFLREDLRGTSPKVFVSDAAGRVWRVKGGLEVRSESFCTRLASALGYYAEPTYFLATGHIDGVYGLRRASGFIAGNGDFTWASFERFEPGLRFLDSESWTWSNNPFDGTPALNGLKILVMLVSDWDNKDARNSLRGSNLGIVEEHRQGRAKWIYFVDDWGQSLGRWGDSYAQTSTFDCAGFSQQTREFVLGAEGAEVRFGYHGQHTADFERAIRRSDVAWLMQWLGRISDDQLRAGLRASGANAQESTCLSAALRSRIEQLRNIAAPQPQP